jgi:hypothetical protein
MNANALDDLSVLQKGLLGTALMAHYRIPVDIACRSEDPGCFELKSSMAGIDNLRERASRRAAAGRSIERLVRRGFLECCSRGHWRLTRRGFKVARALHPEVSPLKKRQVAAEIAWRKTMNAYLDEHPAISGRRRRPRTKALTPPASAGLELKPPKRVAIEADPGIEIDF